MPMRSSSRTGHKVYLADALYVPSRMATPAIREGMIFRHFQDQICKIAGPNRSHCPERSSRPTEVCMQCPAFTIYDFAEDGDVDGVPYTSLALGDFNKLPRIQRSQVVDLRGNDRMTSRIAFKEHLLHGFQKTAVKSMASKSRGILVSAPRTGKTLMMVCLAIKKGRKTLILAHQDDLCKQFYRTVRTFCRNVSRRSVLLVSRSDQLWSGPVADITISTYQRLIGGRMKHLPDIRDRWGCVMVDEVHRANANRYAEVVAQLGPRYMYGCSGTPSRKDGKEVVMQYVMGPIRHNTAARVLTPKVYVYKADSRKVRAKHWTAIVRSLAKDPKRNAGIIDRIIDDVLAGHSVVVPCTFRWYVDALVEEVNNVWFKRTGRDESPAAAFYRYPNIKQKEAVLDRARNGTIRVTVAIRSMLLGVDVPRWSSIHQIFPINNEPALKQEIMRICTPRKDKLPPVIRFLGDTKCGASAACFVASIYHIAEMHVKNKKVADMSAVDWQLVDEIAKSRRSGRGGDSDPVAQTIGRPGATLVV